MALRKPNYHVFTDTDSLTYYVTTEDLYQDMKQDVQLYDTSNYPQDHFLYSTTNKKVIGKFKDETAGLPIREWVGLRAKMYSMKLDDDKEKKTGKGINKNVLKKEIKHQDFKDCLFNHQEYTHTMVNFRSQQHQLFTIKQTKKALSPFDDKRYILEDGYTTRAHGHWRNGIAKPSKEITPELIESMEMLSIACNREVQEMEEPKVVLQEPNASVPINSSREIQELNTSVPTNAFYKYLSSFW